MSNLRWVRRSPYSFTTTVSSPARFFTDQLELIITTQKEWQFFINRRYIASFNSWEEAAGAAPMLYSLHTDSL